jgi:hypothetical protein
MNHMTQAQLQAPALERLTRLAGWFAYASGVVSTIGVVFFVAMLAVKGPFGRLNDICVMIQYLLALPIPLALHRLLQARAPFLSKLAMLIGILGMMAVVVLQFLLIVGVLSFSEQVGPVTFALVVVVGAWLVITGYLSRSTGKLPRSMLVSILAVPYFGYPVWAFWLGRHLLSGRMIEQSN